MSAARSRVELRPRRDLLLLHVAVGIGLLAIGFWLSGFAGWLTAAVGIAFATYAAHQLVRRRPRLVLTESSIAWPGQTLQWNEVASIREVSWRQRLARFRFLGIEAVGHGKRSRMDPRLFGVDFTINVRGLERPVHDVFALVEAYSGLQVGRPA